MVQKLKKAEGENKGLTKDIYNMRAVIKTLTSSLGEKWSKTIEDLQRQMVHMEKENIKLINENKKIKEDFQKAFQNRKDLTVVFQIIVDNSKQIVLKKDEAKHKFSNGNKWIQTLMIILQTSDVKITASIQPVAKLNLKIRVSNK